MPKQILIADDSQSIREILAFSLERAGYSVLVASDGMEAYNLLDGRAVDLLLTDYYMPNVNGLELIIKVRQLEAYKYLPILVLTTEKQTEFIAEARDAGATGWLLKPFSTEKLLQTLRKVIR
ncbi:MAG TPA: response regulator [Prolixibacteraceae bacterium]|nr:response regulator [Prolixibacteraceae bacterium]